MTKQANIMFSGGGTLGHIYPMMSVCRMLKEMDYNLYFIGTINGLEKEFLKKESIFIKTFYLDSEGIKRSFTLKNIKAVFKHFKNIKKSKKILKDYKIDLVIGMGGYVSAAVVKAGIDIKIKTIIHEQNSVLGLANRLVYKKVDKVLLSYNLNIKNSLTIGNPRVSEVYKLYKDKVNNDLGYCLIVGGSRGAKKINDFVIELREQFLSNQIKVILITGKTYYQENYHLIKELKTKDFEVLEFSHEMLKLLNEARVVVSRSGATTLSEIIALKKVCLLIPSPNVTSNHQEKNADELVGLDCAFMLKEKDLTKEILFDNIYKLYNDKSLRNKIINNLNFNTKLDSLDEFLREVMKLLNN